MFYIWKFLACFMLSGDIDSIQQNKKLGKFKLFKLNFLTVVTYVNQCCGLVKSVPSVLQSKDPLLSDVPFYHKHD